MNYRRVVNTATKPHYSGLTNARHYADYHGLTMVLFDPERGYLPAARLRKGYEVVTQKITTRGGKVRWSTRPDGIVNARKARRE